MLKLQPDCWLDQAQSPAQYPRNQGLLVVASNPTLKPPAFQSSTPRAVNNGQADDQLGTTSDPLSTPVRSASDARQGPQADQCREV